MNRFLVAILLSLVYTVGYSQLDSTQNEVIVGDTLFKKYKSGFYKSYQEFVNQSPSIERKFKLIDKSSDRLDKNGVVRVKYKLEDGEQKLKFTPWGFSDDSLVYIRFFTSLFNDYYWKLECNAAEYPFMFVYLSQNGGYKGIGFLLDRMMPIFDIYYLDKNGKIKLTTVKNLKKLFSVIPEIEDEYINHPNKRDNKIKKEFLIKFNMQLSQKK